MFYVTAKVGTMYAVFDNSDGSVEWFSKDQLKQYLDMGVQINGVTNEGIKIVENMVVQPTLDCNWTSSRRNIIFVADKVTKSNNEVIFYAEGKKYKSKIVKYSDNEDQVLLKFTNGLLIWLDLYWLDLSAEERKRRGEYFKNMKN